MAESALVGELGPSVPGAVVVTLFPDATYRGRACP
jgi:hypothetical protein